MVKSNAAGFPPTQFCTKILAGRVWDMSVVRPHCLPPALHLNVLDGKTQQKHSADGYGGELNHLLAYMLLHGDLVGPKL